MIRPLGKPIAKRAHRSYELRRKRDRLDADEAQQIDWHSSVHCALHVRPRQRHVVPVLCQKVLLHATNEMRTLQNVLVLVLVLALVSRSILIAPPCKLFATTLVHESTG